MADRTKGETMTRLEFISLCGELLINPDLALENEKIKEALKNRDDKAVKNLLKTEF